MNKLLNVAASTTFIMPNILGGAGGEDYPDLSNDCDKCRGYHVCTCVLSFEDLYQRAMLGPRPHPKSPQYEPWMNMNALVGSTLDRAEKLCAVGQGYVPHVYPLRDRPALNFQYNRADNYDVVGKSTLDLKTLALCEDDKALDAFLSVHWNQAFNRCVVAIDWVEAAISSAPKKDTRAPFAYIPSTKEGAVLVQGIVRTRDHSQRTFATPVQRLLEVEVVAPGAGFEAIKSHWSKLYE